MGKTMMYCEFMSDQNTLRNIEELLDTSQQREAFKIYLASIERKKHPYSFLNFYQNYVEKYNLFPDINYNMLETLDRVQCCSRFNRTIN